MKRLIVMLGALCVGSAFAASAHTFEIDLNRDAFVLDGEPVQIRCGEVHFPRVPREYWRHRLRMCKAMGLNAVCAYMFWNFHEPVRGRFDFSGDRDVATFCRTAQEEGLWVILRPGPYSCAEWEFGGLPWWLLGNEECRMKNEEWGGPIRLRSRDPRFMEPAKAYLRRVGQELRDLQITHGGPILMVQDENEYGFFGNDPLYIKEIYETLREAGFDVPIFTCNPAYHLKAGDIPEVFKVVNFGADPSGGFAKLREVLPHGPLMCGEYYPAWYDSWGQSHHTKPVARMLADIDWMLAHGGSFSLYMAHGGTSFGPWAGQNSPFAPVTSSYDYEAPISEQGRATPKFHALRELLKKYMTDAERAALPEPPAPLPTMSFTSDAGAEIVAPANMRQLTDKATEQPLSMERLGCGYGMMAYLTDLQGRGGMLKAPNVRDQAAVFAVGDKGYSFLGFLDRRFPSRGVAVPEGTKDLMICVTHMGRYHFGAAMNHAEKGLLPPVTLDGKEQKGWWALGFRSDEAFAPAPQEVLDAIAPDTPCTFKRFRISFPKLADTWLDVRGWKKGDVWVNGHHLGRFWGIGPTQTMFVPGCWLREGENEVVVFDFAGNVPMKGLAFLDAPILDELRPEDDFITAPKRESAPFTPPETPTLRGEFPDTAEAQTVWLEDGAKTRRVAFVADSAWAGGDVAAIGEFELLDADGRSLPHDKWTFVSVSSEETAREDGAAENAIDGQISNFWHSKWSDPKAVGPHYLVIDLGGEAAVAGFRYTPRQSHRNGRIRAWRFYRLK